MAMEPVASKLKSLRKTAAPRVTVRAMAEALDMPLGTYARYESAYDFKKPHLPIDLTRRIAAVLAQHGVDPAEVMKLAGLDGDEAAPEGRNIEAAIPPLQFVQMAVALPNEAALMDMFRALLIAVPADATRDETAAILARRLPAGLARIGPLAPDHDGASWLASDAAAPDRGTDHSAAPPAPRK